MHNVIFRIRVFIRKLLLELYMKRGWFRESYRHSLASKGIRTSLVANSRKGNRSRVEDVVWDDKKKRWVDWRKVASAYGIRTGNKRKTLRKGDTFSPIEGINIYEGQVEAERQPAFTEFEYMPRQVTLPVMPPIVQEYAQIGSLSEQQAQPVEGGLPEREVPSPQPSLMPSFGVENASILPSLMEPEQAIAMAPKVAMASKKEKYIFPFQTDTEKGYMTGMMKLGSGSTIYNSPTEVQLDDMAGWRYGKSFRELSQDQRKDVLGTFESEEVPHKIREDFDFEKPRLRNKKMAEYLDHAGSVYGGDL